MSEPPMPSAAYNNSYNYYYKPHDNNCAPHDSNYKAHGGGGRKPQAASCYDQSPPLAATFNGQARHGRSDPNPSP